MAESLGIAETLEGKTRRNKPATIVRFTGHFARSFVEYGQHFQDFAPALRRPMVHKPQPWTEKLPGGYLIKDKNGDLPLIKPNIAAGATKGVLGADWTISLKAINSLQESRWKINGEVFAQMQVIRERCSEGNLNLDNDQQERLGLAIIPNSLPVRYMIDVKCDAVQDIKDETEIYFPCQFDYRGRLYPIPPGVNPQEDDAGRALLKFSKSHPLGTSGSLWLAIHLANSWSRDVS